MAEIVGIRFKRAGRVYYFDPAGIDLKINDCVVVETSHGVELGKVVIAPRTVAEGEVTEPLKPVTRKATPEDIKRVEDLQSKEEEALIECGKQIARLNLSMKLLTAEYNLDGSRLTCCFSAEERVDFRELVRELTHSLKTRVELRQVGPRDEAKLVGGFGRCGRQLCCASFLTEFDPISIKMAKDQDLPLNPMKISGVCGRLLCCLSYERDQYRDIKAKLPKMGQRVSTPTGLGSVVGVNPLRETVMVEMADETTQELSLDQITVVEGP